MPDFSVSIGLLYKVNVFVKTSIQGSLIANFHFPDATGLITVALNSSCNQKLEKLAFPVSTSLSSANNGGRSTDSDIFVFLNVKGSYI